METGHPSTRAVNSGSGNRALRSKENVVRYLRLSSEVVVVHGHKQRAQTAPLYVMEMMMLGTRN